MIKLSQLLSALIITMIYISATTSPPASTVDGATARPIAKDSASDNKEQLRANMEEALHQLRDDSHPFHSVFIRYFSAPTDVLIAYFLYGFDRRLQELIRDINEHSDPDWTEGCGCFDTSNHDKLKQHGGIILQIGAWLQEYRNRYGYEMISMQNMDQGHVERLEEFVTLMMDFKTLRENVMRHYPHFDKYNLIGMNLLVHVIGCKIGYLINHDFRRWIVGNDIIELFAWCNRDMDKLNKIRQESQMIVNDYGQILSKLKRFYANYVDCELNLEVKYRRNRDNQWY